MSTQQVDDHTSNMLETWKTTVQVQQHFNTLEMQIRGLAVTVLTAVLGAAGLGLGSGKEDSANITLGSLELPLASILLLAGLLAWFSFYFMDRFWYHRLLEGAVNNGLAIEKELKRQLPGILLTTAIGKASIIHFGPGRQWELHSKTKLDLFYGIVGLVVLVFFVASLFVG